MSHLQGNLQLQLQPSNAFLMLLHRVIQLSVMLCLLSCQLLPCLLSLLFQADALLLMPCVLRCYSLLVLHCHLTQHLLMLLCKKSQRLIMLLQVVNNGLLMLLCQPGHLLLMLSSKLKGEAVMLCLKRCNSLEKR